MRMIILCILGFFICFSIWYEFCILNHNLGIIDFEYFLKFFENNRNEDKSP